MKKDLNTWFEVADYNGYEFRVNANGTEAYYNDKRMKIHSVMSGSRTSAINCCYLDNKEFSMGKMVALAFVPNPKNHPIAIKKNQQSLDDVYTNLVWGDHAMLNKIRKGLKKYIVDTRQKIPIEDRELIADRLENGASPYDIAKMYGVTYAAVMITWKKVIGKTPERTDPRAYNRTYYPDNYSTGAMLILAESVREGNKITDVSENTGVPTSLLWKWSIMSDEDIRDLPNGLVKLEDLKPVKRGVDPLYITMDLAYMFDVTNEATYYWDRLDRLKPYNEEREKNQPKLYRQSDIVEFLKCAYRGDYQPSTVDIYRAIKYMDVTVDLPEKRIKDSYLKSHEKQRGTSKGEYKRRAIPTISEGEPQVRLYSTIEVAQLMEVSPKTVNYWTVTNKLSFYTRQNNYGYFYTVTSMVKFLKEMHMGKYKNSQLNVHKALINLELEDEVELPEIKRGKVMKQVKDNKVYNIKHPLEIVMFSNKHVKLKSREAYFKSIAKFGTKKRDS